MNRGLSSCSGLQRKHDPVPQYSAISVSSTYKHDPNPLLTVLVYMLSTPCVLAKKTKPGKTSRINQRQKIKYSSCFLDWSSKCVISIATRRACPAPSLRKFTWTFRSSPRCRCTSHRCCTCDHNDFNAIWTRGAVE